MKTIILILLLCGQAVAAQVKVNEIRLKFGSEFHKAKEPDVIFPVISTNNKEVDDKINFCAINELTADDSTTDISKTLFRSMNEGLAELDYEITLRRKDILSYRLDARGCGAYCSSYSIYMNFDLHTGNLLKIHDVINGNALDSFRAMVFRDKVKALKADLKEKDQLLAAKEIDTSTYQVMTDYIKENCIDNADIEEFILDPEFIEIIDECEFPHFIASMQPDYKLKYSYNKIKKFINPAFLEKLKLSSP